MASTLVSIRTLARTELQETVAGFWADAELNAWITRAHMDLTRATKQEASSTLTLASGTESYSLPTDFYQARRVELQSSVGSPSNWFEVPLLSLDNRRPGDPLSSATFTSVPIRCYIFAGKIYFVPVPDLAYSGTLYYFKNATPLVNDSDPILYPESVLADTYDPLLVFYTCGMALRKRQDNAYTTYLADYAAGRADLIREADDRGSAAPLIVSDDWMEE